MTYSLNSEEKDGARELIAALTSMAEIMTVRQGEELQLAEDGRYLYFVLRGKMEVSYFAQETRIIVALIGVGNFFGEIGFFDGITHLRNMRALEETEVLVFAYETLRQLEKDDPKLLIRLLLFTARTICRKFRAVVEDCVPAASYAAMALDNRQAVTEPLPLDPHFFLTAVGRGALRLVEDLKTNLFEVSRGLQEDASQEIPSPVASRCFFLLDQFYAQLIDFSHLLTGDTEEAGQAWSYLFKEIFPYFMRSRFAERIYYKPKGFFGDYLTMEMIYRNVPDGDGKLGRLVDEWCLRAKGAQAIRDRRRSMARQLSDFVAERREETANIRLLHLGCGSSRELFDFLAQCECTEKIEAFCIDADAEALHFISRSVDTLAHRATVRLMQENPAKWALGRAKHDLGLFDCVYSAGLADYLDDRLLGAFINRCYNQLRPGGVLIVWNFLPNPDQLLMDNILKWRLYCRTSGQLRNLFAESLFGSEIEILMESGSTNACVRASKKV